MKQICAAIIFSLCLVLTVSAQVDNASLTGLIQDVNGAVIAGARVVALSFTPQQEETQVRYTAVFSNEDGGTPTAALMARWGRAADIEWVYEFRARDGRIVEESYQGIAHEKKAFKGRRINGNHPVLSIVSDNNNFSDVLADQTISSLRFALLPVAVSLHSSTRESVLDANPSLYRVVAEELAREWKLKAEPTSENTISDPRK